MINFWNTLTEQLITYPIAVTIVLFCINLYIFTKKYKENKLKLIWSASNKKHLSKIGGYFMVMFSLITSNSIYSYVIFEQSEQLTFTPQDLNIFLVLIYASIILKNVVLFAWAKQLIKNISKTQLIISYSIVGIAITDIPATIWLIYILWGFN